MAGVDILATAFNGANAAFIADLYARWVADPGAVDPSFAELFAALNDEAAAVLTDASGASWAPRQWQFGEPEPAKPAAKGAAAGRAAAGRRRASAEQVRAATKDSLRALMMIRAYRVRGHLEAKLDPLGLQVPAPASGTRPAPPTASPPPTWTGRSSSTTCSACETATLREILDVLRETYCGPIGVEFMHIQDPDQKAWIQRRVEGAPWRTAFDAEAKQRILRQT